MSRLELTEREDAGRRAGRSTSDRDLSELLLRACHDLRSSLRAIRGPAELLARGGSDVRIPEFGTRLAFIVDGVRRIDLLADGLSSYSIALQIDESSFQPTRMDVILRSAIARLAEQSAATGAEVTSDELPRVSGNPDRLVQVFENLLSNALRHSNHVSPRIHISAAQQIDANGTAPEWRFAVRDDGPGIEREYLERIFKPFESLQSTEGKGVGLGLTICRAIVERHGGRIWAESAPGTGSTFFFTLPVVA